MSSVSRSAMTCPLLPETEITLRRSARARRMLLRVSRLDGRVTLSAPARLPRYQIDAFLRERADWIAAALADIPERVAVTPGSNLLFKGKTLKLCEAATRAARIEGNALLIPADPGGTHTPTRVACFLKMAARSAINDCVARHAPALGRNPSAIVLRDTRSRWGSCTVTGRVMLSWRLVMAPPEVLDYVVAHELAHLVEMNHSTAFWRIVAQLCPGWKRHRDWLREHGHSLHRYDFASGNN